MLGRLPAKGLLAIAAVVIAGTFVALMVTSRGPTRDELADRDRLEEFAAEQQALSAERDCVPSVDHAVTAAADYLVARYGEGAADAIRAIASHRCQVDRWPTPVLRCLDRVTSDNEMQRCIGQLEEHQQRALVAEMTAFKDRPRVVPPDASDDLADAEDLSALPYACQEYDRLMTKIMTCDKLPQASRAAMKQALDEMKKGWADLASMPASSRDAMGTACQAGADALEQAMSTICGP